MLLTVRIISLGACRLRERSSLVISQERRSCGPRGVILRSVTKDFVFRTTSDEQIRTGVRGRVRCATTVSRSRIRHTRHGSMTPANPRLVRASSGGTERSKVCKNWRFLRARKRMRFRGLREVRRTFRSARLRTSQIRDLLAVNIRFTTPHEMVIDVVHGVVRPLLTHTDNTTPTQLRISKGYT